MALTAANIQFRTTAGVALVSGKLNNLFGNVQTGTGISYAAMEVANMHSSLTLSAVKAWVVEDVRGGAFAIASDGAGAAVALSAQWDDVDETTLTFSSPNSFATGITLPNIPPQQKVRLVLRRNMTGATAASPENNRVYVGGTSPL